MYNDEINEGNMNFEDIDFLHESQFLFNSFSSNKKLNIDYGTINDFLIKFDIMYKNEIFKNFVKPMIQEYFSQQLNYLLLIDFIITFFKTNDNTFNIKKINTAFIFDFFVKLGEFYSFMNYLDVDDKFVDYLKMMITLYTLQLRREVIEHNFNYTIEILDNFFANEIMPKVFEEINYKNMNEIVKKIKKFEKKFEKELKDYNPTISYNRDEFNFLNNMFTLGCGLGGEPIIKVNTTEVIVDNPTPPPINNYNNVEIDSDTENDSDYYSDDDYYGRFTSRNRWTPTIKKYIPNIEESDPNYKSYRMSFIFKKYENIKNEYNNLLKEVKMMSSGIRIKDYTNFFPDNNTKEIVKVKTIIGIELDFKLLDKNIINNVYNIACEYGHLEIVKAYITFYNSHLINIDIELDIEKAAVSPNREILKFLKDTSQKNKQLKNLFQKFKDIKFYEPKIRFN